MNKFINTIVAVSAATMMLAVVAVPAPAQAQTIAELQAQISALMAQISALTGSTTTTGGSSYTFTRDLTIGSTGTDVMELQKFLNGKGFAVSASGAGSAGQESSYFGALTASALARYQAANGIAPAVGYFGPMTRANVNATGGSTTPGGSDDDDDDSSDDGDLEGGSGSITGADYVAGLSNEEVGEDAEDAEVAGLDIEADDESDIEIVAVNLNFSQGTANDDLDEYASEISIMLDGEEFARVDAADFEDDDNYDKTISLDDGAIIRSGEEGRLTVAVSGVSNLDSADVGDTWTVEFESVRFKDAENAVVTDSDTGDINDGAGRTFSFESFATASDSEFKVALSDENPESAPINVDDADDTDNVELLRFTLEAEGDSDLRVRDLPVTLTVTGATDIDAVASTLYVTIDGEEFSETLSTSAAAASVTFDDFDYTIGAGEEVEVVVTADINDIETGFDEGDTLKAEFTASNRAVADVEDETGENLNTSSDRTGTALGEEMAFYDVFAEFTLVDIEEADDANSNDTNDDESSSSVFRYTVKAIDGDVYVSDTATATDDSAIEEATVPSNQVLYRVTEDGTATVTSLSGSAVTFSTDGNRVTDSGVTNGVKITEGSTGDFTLTIRRTNTGLTTDDGVYRFFVQGFSWATTDTATQNVYDFNLEDWKDDTGAYIN